MTHTPLLQNGLDHDVTCMKSNSKTLVDKNAELPELTAAFLAGLQEATKDLRSHYMIGSGCEGVGWWPTIGHFIADVRDVGYAPNSVHRVLTTGELLLAKEKLGRGPEASREVYSLAYLNPDTDGDVLDFTMTREKCDA